MTNSKHPFLNFANLIKVSMIVLLILAGIRYHQYLNPSTIASFVDKYGIMAPFLFIVLCGVKPILFFLPIMGLAIVAGMLFGPLKGAIYVSIGGAFSTIVGFYFARWIGRDMIKRIGTISKKVKQIDEWAKEHGKNAVFSMRCFNLPWDIVSYWAGLSSIKFRDFYIASIIPLVPISFLYTYFGSKILTPKSWGFVISLSIIFALGATPFIKQRLKRNS